MNLTFSLYAHAELRAFVEEDELFSKAAAAGWFPIGDRDMVLICVAMDSGAVCLIPGWSITEEMFEIEKRYKSLKTFFRAQIRHEKQAARNAVGAEEQRAAKKASLTGLDDPNAVDDEGRTLLLLALQDDDLEAVERELDRGADPNMGGRGQPLFYAIRRRNAAAVQLLLAAGADPNLQQEGRLSLLYEAASRANLDVVKLLVEAGAAVNVPGWQTPLGNSVRDGDLPISGFLLEQGADPNADIARSDSHRPTTALTHATRNPELIRLLLDYGADPRACRPTLLLELLSDDANLEAVRLLVDAGADLKTESALHQNVTPAMAKLLIQAGADVNAVQGGLLQTPLMRLAEVTMLFKKKERPERVEVMRILLDAKADINRQDALGRTVLMIAMQENNIEGVELLLEYQPEVKLSDKKGRTATDYLAHIRPKAKRMEIGSRIETGDETPVDAERLS